MNIKSVREFSMYIGTISEDLCTQKATSHEVMSVHASSKCHAMYLKVMPVNCKSQIKSI